MSRLLARLERFAIPNLTLVLTVGSVLCLISSGLDPEVLSLLTLSPTKVMQGEVWRLVTFVFFPLSMHPFFAAFTYYLFYLMGTMLETEWGAAKFNLYVLLACVATGVMAWWVPSLPQANGFIYGSIFLAFAYVQPDFVIYLLFILPVKVKWIAAVQWIGYLLTFVFGTWPVRAAIVLANANFALFFGRSIIGRMRGARHHMQRRARDLREAATPFHTCHTCRVTELSDRTAEFRVCTACAGGKEYCRQHLDAHAHA